MGNEKQRHYDRIKRAIDILGATGGLIIASPIMLAASVAIRATMGSPIFFKQMRPGKNGQSFEMVKFRTMRQLKDGEDAISSDAVRLSEVGRILRKASIDELPTLFNLLKGDISLVGPRPLLIQYLERYSVEQARRHEVKPGITGWAQVNGRNELTWDEKFELDVWYVDNRNLALDLRILMMTVLKVIKREGISHAGQETMTEFMGNSDE